MITPERKFNSALPHSSIPISRRRPDPRQDAQHGWAPGTRARLLRDVRRRLGPGSPPMCPLAASIQGERRNDPASSPAPHTGARFADIPHPGATHQSPPINVVLPPPTSALLLLPVPRGDTTPFRCRPIQAYPLQKPLRAGTAPDSALRARGVAPFRFHGCRLEVGDLPAATPSSPPGAGRPGRRPRQSRFPRRPAVSSSPVTPLLP